MSDHFQCLSKKGDKWTEPVFGKNQIFLELLITGIPDFRKAEFNSAGKDHLCQGTSFMI